MKFCKKCGHQLNDGANACPQCGMPVQKPAKKTQKKKPSLSLSKKQKWMLFILAGMFLVVFISYQLVANIFDQHRAVDQFEEALIEGDTEQLAEMVTSSDPGFEIEPDDLQGLVRDTEDPTSFHNEAMSSLRQQAERMDDEGGDLLVNSMDDSIVDLKVDGKNWFIFDAYSFEIQPVYVTITTDETDTVLYMDEEKIGIADQDNFSKQFGPFVPGIYTMNAQLEHDYATLEREEVINLTHATENDMHVDLDLNGEYIHIDSNEPEADVYVNGDAIGMTVEETERPFGPVLTDGSMTMHAEREYPWGNASSEEEEITGANLSLDVLIETNELKEQLMDMVTEDAESWDEDVEDIDYDLDSFRVENIEDQYTATFEAVIHYDSDDSDSESHQAFTVVYDTEDEEWLMDENVEIGEVAADDEEEEQEPTSNENSLRMEYREKADDLEDEIAREAKELYEHDTEIGFAGQYSEAWDNLLNEVWGELEDSMASDTFETLQSEQIEWIETREQTFADIADDPDSESGRESDYLANETKDRTYYLIENYMD